MNLKHAHYIIIIEKHVRTEDKMVSDWMRRGHNKKKEAYEKRRDRKLGTLRRVYAGVGKYLVEPDEKKETIQLNHIFL